MQRTCSEAAHVVYRVSLLARPSLTRACQARVAGGTGIMTKADHLMVGVSRRVLLRRDTGLEGVAVEV